MYRSNTRTPVAIFDSRADFLDTLQEALEREGMPSVTALLADIQNGTLDLIAFLDVHDPQVIVYDLPRPFECHWNFLRLLKQSECLSKKTWILTTTDKKALDAAVGAGDVIEIIFGEPYGIGEVVEAVRLALKDERLATPQR